jgi:hypothetical protein
MYSKVHVTIAAAVIAVVAVVCATVILSLVVVNGIDLTVGIAVAAGFFSLATGCVGVIGGVAVPTSPPESS